MKKKILSLTLACLMMVATFAESTTNVYASNLEEPAGIAMSGELSKGEGFIKINNHSSDAVALSDEASESKEYALTEKNFGTKARYIVELEHESDRDAVKAELIKLPQTKLLYEYYILFNAMAVETGDGYLDYIMHINGVKSVERAEKLVPLMNNARELIHVNEAGDYLKSIGADDESIGKAYDGRGMLIANIDSGMDAKHKDMRLDPDAEKVAKIKSPTKFGMSMKIPHGFNYMDGGKDTVDNYPDGSFYHDPHGMHIGGILAANASDEEVKNHKGIKGVAPNAQVMSYKIYTYTSDAFAGDETMFHAFEDCIKHDADVISISSGFHGTGLKGEKYWQAIRKLREKGIPVCVATGNYATSSSDSSWDRYANNALKMTDTGNVTRTAAHEDAIAVGSARNTKIRFNAVNIGNQKFKYSQIGAFFDRAKFPSKEYSFVYLGKCQDEDILGKDLEGKIVVMDRIFSTDMKYAFKKVRDKGALGVIVVNTVSYYNRDDWETIPAMGYEEDENTTVQVFSLSGEDGVKLWSMIKEYNGDTSYNSNGKYRVDMKKYDALKPAVGQEHKIMLDFNLDDIVLDEERSVPAGSTSWGPRNDLLLKPDVSAPGKNIYSTLNVVDGESRYGYMSGTSMATPVVSASTVIIRPRLKKLVETKVLKDMGIDLVSLTKIMLQNTASPMIDETTENDGKYLYASPRQQGAGLINVLKAVKNNVVISSKALGSDGETNSYGSVSLREIKSGQKTFTITLSNTSNKDINFRVSASPVTTDGNIPKLKLDELSSTEDNGKTVAEIHPELVKGAEIKFDVDEVTVPANSNFNLSATMKTGDAHNQFVESFIKFESANEEDNPSLSMPVMGFAGDWNIEPIIDKWAWEEGSKSAAVVGYDDEGRPKRPGTLNIGVGGDHDIDNFHPAGIIKNTRDGNPTLKQDPDLFALNNVLFEDYVRSEAISEYEKNPNVTPSPLILRSASNAKISIVDESKDRTLKVMNVSQFVLGILNSKRNTASGLKPSRLKILGDLKWDGRIYNPHHVDKKSFEGSDYEEIIGGEYPVAEGQYYYEFMYRLTPDYPWQKSYIPVKVDNTRPTIESIDVSEPNNIKIVAKDTYHMQKPEFKGQTLYQEDQKNHPEKFDEAKGKVWYLGAKVGGKELPAYKDSDASYLIEKASKDLVGNTLKIAAIDGAGNASKAYELKFSDAVDGKVKVEVLEDGASIRTLEIDEAKFDKRTNSNPKDNQDEDKDKDQDDAFSEKPKFELYQNASYRDLKEADLKKKIKEPIKAKRMDFITGEEVEYDVYADWTDLDDEGFPKHYENGDPIQFENETIADLKKAGFIGTITPNADGGFNIRGKVRNVTKSTNVYFQSKAMEYLNKRAKVSVLNYDDNEKTLEFDLYANKDDVDNKNGIDYREDIAILVKNSAGESKIKFRMPKTVVEKRTQSPVIPKLKSIEDSATGDFNHRVTVQVDGEYKRYFTKTSFKINEGYIIKLLCYNPGKKGLDAIEEAKYVSSDMSDKDVEFEILPGFNMLRMEVYKATTKDDIKESNIVEAKGFCIYYDGDGPELDMSTESFNPDQNDTLYVKKSPLVMEGVVGDKGGFNWHIRINESVVDEYLIYGDLTSDNRRPFRVEVPCNDKDRLDWAVKDYAQNSPKNFVTQYVIRIDSTKPRIEIKDEEQGDDYNIAGSDTRIGISIKDEVDNGDKGNIKTKEVLIGGVSFDENKALEDYPSKDGKYTIYVRAVDYANNASVAMYEYDPIAKKLSQVENEEFTVTVDNGKEERDYKVKSGEDFTLPAADYIPEGKIFAGWDVDGTTKNASETIFINKDTRVSAIYKDKVEKVFAQISFERNCGYGDMDAKTVELGTNYKLPLNRFTAPQGKVFDTWICKGVRMNPGSEIIVDGDLTITAAWKEIPTPAHDGDDDEYEPAPPKERDWSRRPSRRPSYKKADEKKEIVKESTTAELKPVVELKTDYDTHWAKPAIDRCFAENLFNDFALKTAFMPEQAATRAEFVTALGRLMKVNPKEYTVIKFKDVDPMAYYAGFIAWASEKQIVLGMSKETFEPNGMLTREQMATIIIRLLKAYGINLEKNANLVKYTDYDKIAAWAKDAVSELTSLEIVNGNANGTYNPKGLLKRAELAEIILKLINKLGK